MRRTGEADPYLALEIDRSSVRCGNIALAAGAAIVNLVMAKRSRYLTVPSSLGATAATAARFEATRNRVVGPARVVDPRTTEGSGVLMAARAQNSGGIRTNAQIGD